MKRDKITHERRHIRTRLEILDTLLNGNEKRGYEQLRSELNNRLQLKGEVPVSIRTLKYDIAFLENDEGAPIHRPAKGDPYVYYTSRFSFKGMPVDEDDITYLKQAVAILKKATDIKLTSEIDNIISKLQNTIDTNIEDSNLMIAFEEHTRAAGQEHFQNLFDAIQGKCALKIIYQPFGKTERDWVVSPYLLKEYNNRWFLICKRPGIDTPTNIALDRIKKISNCKDVFEENTLFDPQTYFNNIIGVTFPEGSKVEEILIKVNPGSKDYILTKPIHKSQEVIKSYKNGEITVKLDLVINDELKHYLLSYGPRIHVIKPNKLRFDIVTLLNNTIDHYS